MSLPPLEELVNTFEVETAAQQKLDAATFALIEGGDRRPFERITFRPRMMVNTTKLDLTLDLFGKMLAPIVAGPLAQQKRFHPEGEAATARGASDAKAVFVVAEHSDFPAGKSDWWYQTGPAPVAARIEEAAAQGCKALCITLSDTGTDWASLDTLRRTTKLPVILKGILRADEAKDAAAKGIDGIVVSSYTATPVNATAIVPPMEVLPGIVDSAGRMPVLIDGGFRRGTDIMMALALGAKAVLVARPVAWGLAAYGADGVRYVLEMLQTELARTMAMCGKPNLGSLDRATVKLHRW